MRSNQMVLVCVFALVLNAAPGQSQTPDASVEKTFELIVVGPDKEPVPGAMVEFRTRPKPTKEWLKHGTFARKASYGSFVRAGDDGRVVMKMPVAATRRLNVSIKTDGYGPYWTGWDGTPTSGTMPESFTAHLDAGRSVGGRVVDELGQPIEGAQVSLSIQYKKRPGDTSSLYVGRDFVTNPEGKWACHFVPKSKSAVSAEITHPEFRPVRKSLAIDGYGIERGQEGDAEIKMERGLVVTGRVTGADGKPVEGALVRTKFLNEIRKATTGVDGVYELTGCEPVLSKIVVSATGLAVDMKELRISEEMAPVDFEMKPGGHVRIRVVDEEGNPIPKTRIFFQRWRSRRYSYFELDHVHQYTDDQGIWEWNEAPEDEFQADICRPGGMQMRRQSLVARKEEYVFTPPPLLVLNGTVVDAETGKPVESFRVVPGIRSSPTNMNWVQDGRDGAFTAKNGEFRFTRNYGYLAHLVRIEAPGYLPAESRDVASDEGNVQLEFRLRKGRDVAAVVLTPAGRPATGAKIALGLSGSQISVDNGSIDDGSTYAKRIDTDENGRFSLAPQGGPYQLLITHAKGYAYVKASPDDEMDEIRLEPWGRVKGVYRVAGKPVAGVTLTVGTDGVRSYGRDVPNIFTHHEVTTGTQGAFDFRRVFPGRGWISREILMMVDDGAQEVTSTAIRSVNVTGDELTEVEFGLSGRGIVGTFLPPKGTPADAVWTFTLVDLEANIPAPGAPPYPGDIQADRAAYQVWFEQWRLTEAGRQYLRERADFDEGKRSAPRFRASVDTDGSFRIDDVPPGDYTLSFNGRAGRHPKAVVGSVEHTFTVPEGNGDFAIGPLQLE